MEKIACPQEEDNRLTINSEIYQMGGDYASLKIDQDPSSEGKDHYFRAVLHQFTSVIFAEEANCSLSDDHRRLLC